MPTETEMKVPVADHAGVVQRLNALRAEWVGEYLQDDMFLDTQERHLLAGDRGLRLRSVQRLDESQGKRRYVLTYKGARQESTVKQREEIELEVSDAQAMREVFDRLGYRLMLHLQKRRRRYRLAGCHAELDTLPLLGRFVEVEGPAEDTVRTVAADLGLDTSQSITDSYASLLMAEAKKRGLPTSPAEFLLTDG